MPKHTLQKVLQYLNKSVHLAIDRPLGSKHPQYGFTYELNYGYVPGTLAADREELDAYFLGANVPLTEAAGICIAIIHRLNDDDDKFVVSATGINFSDEEIRRLTNFQEQ